MFISNMLNPEEPAQKVVFPEDLEEMSPEDMLAENIAGYFEDERTSSALDALLSELRLNREKKQDAPQILAGKTFVITGKVNHFANRDELKARILSLGGNPENLRFRDHEKEELSFYSKATTDIEYKFPWGWGELWGIADRTDYDLGQHQKFSGENMEYLDPTTNEKYLPYYK